MSRIVDVEPLDCLAWKDGEHGTTFDDGVLWVLEKIGELPTIERKTDEWCSDCKEYDHEKHCCPRWNRVIRQTLSEQHKTGKWIQFPNHMAYKCSECGRVIQTTDGQRNVSKHYPFCHCGADMRGEQE